MDLDSNKLLAISNVSVIGMFVYRFTMSNEARVCLGSIVIVFVSSTSSKPVSYTHLDVYKRQKY